MAKGTKIRPRSRIGQVQAKDIKIKVISIIAGAVLGFLTGFIGRTVYYTDTYQLVSIFKFLLFDVFRWAFVAGLIGGFIGYGAGVLIEKRKIHKTA